MQQPLLFLLKSTCIITFYKILNSTLLCVYNIDSTVHTIVVLYILHLCILYMKGFANRALSKDPQNISLTQLQAVHQLFPPALTSCNVRRLCRNKERDGVAAEPLGNNPITPQPASAKPHPTGNDLCNSIVYATLRHDTHCTHPQLFSCVCDSLPNVQYCTVRSPSSSLQ